MQEPCPKCGSIIKSDTLSEDGTKRYITHTYNRDRCVIDLTAPEPEAPKPEPARQTIGPSQRALDAAWGYGGKKPRDRSQDPQTSREAHAQIQDYGIRESQRVVLQLFVRYGEMTDLAMEHLAKRLGIKQKESGLRTRRAELVDRGRIEKKRRTKEAGSNRIVWGLV